MSACAEPAITTEAKMADEINVCRLHVNPKGMLVEPYVQELAMQVRQEIDDKVRERSETAV